MSNSLKNAYDEQLPIYEEAKKLMEKQARDVNTKSEELSQVKHTVEFLTSRLHEKELPLKQLGFANEKLCVGCTEKQRKLEVQNQELILALEEARENIKELQQKLCASNEDNVGMKKVLNVSENNCFKAEQKALAPRELRQRGDVILNLEDDISCIWDQLKWKGVQFKHLEESHQRLQDQLRLTKEECLRENSTMLQEITSLHASLDSQTQISGNLRIQLETCSQALTHQESKTKLLEAQVSQLESRLGIECREDNLDIGRLTAHREKEIAWLRISRENREANFKDMEFSVFHLEQENLKLAESLNELKKSQIRNGASRSLLMELQNEIRNLKQVHGSCSANLEARESEWISQLKTVMGDLVSYKWELRNKERRVEEVDKELDNLCLKVDVTNEENLILPMVLKLEFSEACVKLLNGRGEGGPCQKRNVEDEKVETLSDTIKPLNSMDQQLIHLAEELERHKKMLKESYEYQFRLEEQVLQLENALKEGRRETFDILEEAQLQLAEKIHEGDELEVQLQNLNATAQGLKVLGGGKRDVFEQIGTALLEQPVTEPIGNVSLREQQDLMQICNGKDMCIDTLQKDISFLIEDSIRRESETEAQAKIDAVKLFQKDQERDMSEKEQKIIDLQLLAMSRDMDEDKNQWKLEVEEKNKIIAKLEKEVSDLFQKSAYHEESFVAVVKSKELETEKLMSKFAEEDKKMKALVKKLEFEKGTLLDDIMKLLAERENTLVYMEDLYDQISETINKDAELMKLLQK